MDNLIITGNNSRKNDARKFEMTDLELLNYILGIKLTKVLRESSFCRKKYEEGLLKKFMVENCNPITTPLQVNEKLCKDDENEKADQRIYKSMIDS